MTDQHSEDHHSVDHDALLEALSTGGLPADAPEVLARLKECSECRREIEGLMTIQQELDAAARLRRRVLERARGARASRPESQDQDARVQSAQAALIRQRLEGTPPPRTEPEVESAPAEKSSHRPVPRAFLAAAASILVFVGLWQAGVFDPADPIPMNGGEIELLSPRGTVEQIDLFRWKEIDLTPGGYYRIVIEPVAGPRFESREDLTEPNWTPPAELAATWTEFSWSVVAYRPNGEQDGTSGDPVRVKVTSP